MYPVIRAKNRREQMIQSAEWVNGKDQLEYLRFPDLANIDCITHLFSTRTGGVSRGEFSTLNLSFTRGDEEASVLENYARIAKLFGTDVEHFVTTHQTHTTNILTVTGEDAGKGVARPRNYSDVDGLITKEKGLILSCFFADCVPLYFVDPVKEVIGLAHSGWRGTVAGMGACMVRRMQEEFGCDPKDIRAAIGPSICQDCYEISEEVAIYFREGFWGSEEVSGYGKEAYEAGYYPSSAWLKEGRMEGKCQLDLWLANLVVLRSAGILLENISVTDICTRCNAPYLYSHRATGGKRGNLGAFLMLRDK